MKAFQRTFVTAMLVGGFVGGWKLASKTEKGKGWKLPAILKLNRTN
jgi:hypothetical protein